MKNKKEGKVEVNGSWIDINYLDENIAEAKSQEWEKYPISINASEHHHCIICNISINSKDLIAYKSNTGWLCDYCHNRFIKGKS